MSKDKDLTGRNDPKIRGSVPGYNPASQPVGEPSPEAIKHAKRLIALKWTKETNVDTIAGTWQAGYIFGKMDAAKEGQPDELLEARKEIERLKKLVEINWHEANDDGGVAPPVGLKKKWEQYKKSLNL
jgi:hypothetical protein